MRLIDADALTKQLEEMADNEWNKSVGSSKGLEDAIDVVESMPTIKTFTLADIEENYRKGMEKGLEEQRTHGEWEIHSENGRIYHLFCSECKKDAEDYISGSENWWMNSIPNFCPNCGAPMTEEAFRKYNGLKEGEAE